MRAVLLAAFLSTCALAWGRGPGVAVASFCMTTREVFSTPKTATKPSRCILEITTSRVLPVLLLAATLMSDSALAGVGEREMGIGAYGGVSFGSGQPVRFSFGAQLRATTRVGEWEDCANKGFSVGGVTRLDFPAWNQPRLILGAIGSRTSALYHATAEAGVGLRLHDLAFDTLAGLQLGWGPYAGRLDHTFNRSLWQATGGLVLGSEWLNHVPCV